jgi:hypothetical protein
MKVKIPEWAVECNDENWIVLFWFLRSLTQAYPPYLNRDRTKKGTPSFIYSMLATDFNTLIGSRHDHHRKIQSWPLMNKNFKLGQVSNNDYSCRMFSWHCTVTKELHTRRAKDLVLYLSGCLNNNVISEEPRTAHAINTALKGHFSWFGDEAEENGWYTESK